jgi:hypothetical protein
MNSIFQRANPAIEKLFQEAGSPKKVMCVPIDYAKRQHTALVCNGEGMQLRGPFNIHNPPEGVEFFNEIVKGLCRKHSIKKQFVFFGGEDCSAIAFNFIHALLEEGYLGIGINARDAVAMRENYVASTDDLDLLGIGSVLINKKHGRTLSTEYGPARILREMTHHRDATVKARTACAYRIHHFVDQLMPGFLDEKKSGLTPFSEATLWLMSENFSPRQLMARKNSSLAEKLGLFMLQDVDSKVEKLKHLAGSVLPPPAALREVLQASLSREVATYQHFSASIQEADKVIARNLAPTPGAMLTTVSGIGITLGAGLYAELGDPARDRPLAQLCSYAGLVARLKQSGGPDKPARTLGRSRRACVPLKRKIIDIALKIGQNGPDELKADYDRRENANQRVRFTMGRKMLRICAHIIREKDFFLPPSLLNEPDPALRADYYRRNWDRLIIKWRNAGAVQQAFAPGAPLEEWRLMINELYGLKLDKLSPQYKKLRSR